jgi:hypothetical protein
MTASPAPIHEIAVPDTTAFQSDVVGGYAPVVIRGLVRDWPVVAAGAQSVEAVAAHLLQFDRGAAAEAFVGPPEIAGRFFYSPDMKGFNFERRRGGFAELLRYLLGVVGKDDAPSVYAGALETAQMLPGFAEANPLPLLAGLDAPPRIWLGNRSTITTHFDVSDNMACVAAGQRRFTLFPPDQIHNLYVGPLDRTVAGQPTSMVELNAPNFERFPRFRDALAAAQTAQLAPGDAIYIPALWWHQVEALAPFNALVNYWWNDSPDAAARFDAMVHAAMAIGHMPEARREAWEAMFDTFVFRHHGDPVAHLAPEHRGVLGEPTTALRQYIKAYLARGLQRP